MACLKELGISADHPTWSKVAPEVELLDPPQPYSPLVLFEFNEEKYLKESVDKDLGKSAEVSGNLDSNAKGLA